LLKKMLKLMLYKKLKPSKISLSYLFYYFLNNNNNNNNNNNKK
jgi:hypothetical protein